MKSIRIITFLVIFSVVSSLSEACSPGAFEWPAPQDTLTRSDEASVAFLGTVTQVHDRPSAGWYGLYDATFDVECVYKHGSGSVSKTVKVFRFGFDGGMCMGTDVWKGHSYLVFAEGNPGFGLTVTSINLQEGAIEASPDLVLRLKTKYGCTKPDEQKRMTA